MSYTQKELQLGIKIETDGTNDPCLAEKIARGNLCEDNRYYSKLQEAGLQTEDFGILIPGDKEQSKLSSSELGVGGKNKPLDSDHLETIPTRTDTDTHTVYLGKTAKAAAVPVTTIAQDKHNSVSLNKTPAISPDPDAMEHFGSQIDTALQIEVPRRMELNPLSIGEGGAKLDNDFVKDGAHSSMQGHAGITSDMDGRFRIKAFDTDKYRHNETPGIEEPIEESEISLKDLVTKKSKKAK
jgi:hypothetical protein